MASLCKAKSSLVIDLGRSKIAQVADSVAMLHAGLSVDSRYVKRQTAGLNEAKNGVLEYLAYLRLIYKHIICICCHIHRG